MTHEDDRRTLTSIPYKDGEIKVIITKEDCELGNHYHKVKRENFTLMRGSACITIDGMESKMLVGLVYLVDINEKHSFEIEKNSILYCICSHPYDKEDDYEN